MGAKEQSGRTWPSIFWARGTTGIDHTLSDRLNCLSLSGRVSDYSLYFIHSSPVWD